MTQPKICVVGASNIDLISYVPRMPKLGETLHGTKFSIGFGGKGANQAVMAARLGGKVAMITKLGRDIFGEDTLKNFKTEGIDTTGVTFTEEASSGVAPIAVDPQGNNSIIIIMGANDTLSTSDLENARDLIQSARVVVCQLEIPLEISLHALRIAKQAGVTTIFNPAPARSELPEELYRLSDIFCPNETESEILLGTRIQTQDDAIAAARALLARGPNTVILTLGSRGSLVVTPSLEKQIPAEVVKAVDTTGAGDAFIGSLAYFLGAGLSLEEATQRANKIAAISVQHPGTQTSFPRAQTLPPELLG